MRVPFRLRRTTTPAPATALLLPSHDVGELLRLCAAVGADTLPPVYAAADGFLVLLPTPTDAPFAGTVRLRGLSAHLLLPVDADLVPALLPDEAAALVRDRGLVFLPGGRVLGFAPDQPLTAAALLRAGPVRRDPWQPLPPRPTLAERIESMRLDLPAPTPDDLLDAGGEGIGTEEPRPADAGPARRALGRAALAAGRGLVRLGRMLHLPSVASLGAKWVQQALAHVPRLSEAVLGRQEAALRELLRQFREGRIEEALRHALPLGTPGDRGDTPYDSAQLPTHNLIYSLREIADVGRGPAGVWLGGFDIQRELTREYHRAAEAATRRGDYRRAAYIYGKLLREYRLAANVLMQGGLHRDAAVLYLNKLGDQRAAARAYEAAGELDRALELYRQVGEHVPAGDLLRRTGDEEAAVAEYLCAAEALVRSTGGYLQAAELLLTRARRPDLARQYLHFGWNARPHADDVACALRLARLYAEEDSPRQLVGLVVEAEHYFGPPGHEADARRFFNEVASLAEQPRLAGVREELRDRALLGLAAKLRERAEREVHPGNLAFHMLGPAGPWPPAVVTDADVALKRAVRRTDRGRPGLEVVEISTDIGDGGNVVTAGGLATVVPLAEGVVTAACSAAASGEVFVGFASGAVYGFRPSEGAVRCVSDGGPPVTSLAVDTQGEWVVVLRAADGEALLASYGLSGDSAYVCDTEYPVECTGPAGLSSAVHLADGSLLVGLWDEDRFRLFKGHRLLPWDRFKPTVPSPPTAVVLRPAPDPAACGPALFWLHGRSLSFFAGLGEEPSPDTLGWHGGPLSELGLRSIAPLAWQQTGPDYLELAGVDEGALYWSRHRYGRDGCRRVAVSVSKPAERYLACALVHRGVMAGVTRATVTWLRAGKSPLTAWAVTRVPLPNPVICFPSPVTGELLVVCRDGTLVRLPVPN
jgi:tetratricopeptide (TPR) repeat protein